MSRQRNPGLPLKGQAALPFNRFCDVVGDSLFHWRFRLPGGQGNFTGSVASATVRDLVYADISASSLAGKRGAGEITKNPKSCISLLLVLEGDCLLTQGPSETKVTGRRIGICSTDRPCDFVSVRPFRQISLHFPYEKVIAVAPAIDDWCGGALDASAGIASLLFDHVMALHRATLNASLEDLIKIERLTLDLLAAAVEPRGIMNDTWSRQRLRTRAKNIITSGIENPALNPASIAESLGISLRYLHLLFEGCDYTVGEFIRKCRLEASRSELLLKGRAHQTITQIAFKFGFADASHFSRAFKAEYGLTPSEFRSIGLKTRY